jgi:hypothetical protein
LRYESSTSNSDHANALSLFRLVVVLTTVLFLVLEPVNANAMVLSWEGTILSIGNQFVELELWGRRRRRPIDRTYQYQLVPLRVGMMFQRTLGSRGPRVFPVKAPSLRVAWGFG